ncbi:hypothetical protein [Ornithinimicrobium sufpigmenti]|uniref:hypothetical protein n=1 Tax=Ornithinimicrobium sufpigmenti TaxID=2508882 RepID=UPI001035B8BE|nr:MULTISPECIES: hypothetical protein [unclassified Ornithinimicrobium]
MGTWDVTSDRGRTRAWQALCHELIGVAASLELHVDRTLALVHGRSPEAIERLETDVFGRVPADVKLSLLETVLASTTHPSTHLPAEAHLPFCVPGLRLISRMRNAMAHGEVDADSTGETLVLVGRHRGRHQRHEVPLSRVRYARGQLATALEQDLIQLALWAADRRVAWVY